MAKHEKYEARSVRKVRPIEQVITLTGMGPLDQVALTLAAIQWATSNEWGTWAEDREQDVKAHMRDNREAAHELLTLGTLNMNASMSDDHEHERRDNNESNV